MLERLRKMLDEGYVLYYNDEAYIPSWKGEDAVNEILRVKNQFTDKDFLDLLEGEEVEVSLDFITGSITGYFQLIKEEEI